MSKKRDCRPGYQSSNSQLGYLTDSQPATHCVNCGEKLPFFRDPNQVICEGLCKALNTKEGGLDK